MHAVVHAFFRRAAQVTTRRFLFPLGFYPAVAIQQNIDAALFHPGVLWIPLRGQIHRADNGQALPQKLLATQTQHSINFPQNVGPWESHFGRKVVTDTTVYHISPNSLLIRGPGGVVLG